MRSTLLIITVALLLGSCQPGKINRNYLFDMGALRNDSNATYLSIDPTVLYSREKGYGWIKAPDSVFLTSNDKIPDPLLQDGVMGKDSLIFQIDLPNGEYFATITPGSNESNKSIIRILINGTTIADSITTPWYRLGWRNIRRKVIINDGKALVQLTGIGSSVGLHRIEFRPVSSLVSANFPNGPEQDTTAVMELEKQLEAKVQSGNPDIQYSNQLYSIRQYLQACQYYNMAGWSWANQQTGLSLIHRMYLTADLLEQVVADPNDPLYHKAMYLLAKVYYWLDAEDNNPHHQQESARYFNLLKPAFPDHEVLKMYLGEKIPFDSTLYSIPGAPQWAIHQREAMHRMLRIIEWWVTNRQTPNGELGGKYGDDVEILRWWMPAILGADDKYARQGFQLLADGVWNSGLLDRGFAKRIDDVEHSAELFSDTHPIMLMLNYGNPTYVERCMISMQHFRDTWTGITHKGHRHFKSAYLSSTEVNPNPPFSVDVPLNARACRAGLWTAWYNRHPAIIKLLGQWSDAWIADAARTDKGKPAGLIPAAIGFANESIGGYSDNWFEPNLPYSYYNWESTGHINELQYQLLGMYAITKNEKYLGPLNSAAALMKNVTVNSAADNPVPGTAFWAAKKLASSETNSTGKVLSLAKTLTNGTKYDSLIARYGQPYNKYGISVNEEEIIKGFQPLLAGLRYNFPLLTSEVQFTDRVYVPGSALLSGMYTGHFSNGYEYPAPLVTWEKTGRDVAIFVRNGDKRSLRVSLFNFGDTVVPLHMNTWQLEPGTYQIIMQVDANADGIPDKNNQSRTVVLNERVNSIALDLESRQNTELSIRQVSKGKELPTYAPDLAISHDDIKITNTGNDVNTFVEYTVHNIGSIDARDVLVELLVDDKPVHQHRLSVLEAPLDLNPRTKSFNFQTRLGQGQHIVTIRLTCKQKEITGRNNEGSLVYLPASNTSIR